MLHDIGTDTPMARRGVSRPQGIWEVLGILAAVVPCGILAGLYLATGDIRFILGSFFLGAFAIAIVFIRSPRLRLPRRRAEAGRADTKTAGETAGSRAREKLAAVGGAFRRTVSLQILKLLGFVVWMLAWGVTAALYARVYENVNIGALVILVAVGGFSPVVIYFGLETGVKSLGRRNRERE